MGVVDISNAFIHTDNEKDKNGGRFIANIRCHLVDIMVAVDP